ncbi:hypothetical protein Tco_1335224 [Tanacetum coccineum]
MGHRFGYDGLPIQPVALPSPDYIPGPEDPQAPLVSQDEDEREPMFVHAHDPDYVPETIYPEYIPLEDEHVFPAEEQPLPHVDSPTALSLGCVADSDSEEDLEEDSEEEHADYPADEGEHLWLMCRTYTPSPTGTCTQLGYLSGNTEALYTYCYRGGVEDSCLTTPTPHHYLTTTLLLRKCIVVAAIGRLRASSPSTHHPLRPSPPLPPPPSSLHLSTPVTTSPLPPLPDSLFIAPVDVLGEVFHLRPSCTFKKTGQRAESVAMGIRVTWVDTRVRVLEQDTHEIYAVIEDTQDRQTQIYQTVEALVDDRQYHYETARLLDQEALVSREAWAHSMGLSSAVHYELQGYRTHTWMQDHRINAQESQIAALTAHVSSLQGHLATALGEIRALQAREQARADAPEGTGSSS